MNYTEKTVVTITILVSSLSFTNTKLNGQFMPKRIDYDRAYKVVKDTLWLKQKLWGEVKLRGLGNNPIYSINNDEDAKNFDFIIVPIYKVSKKGADYTLDKNIVDVLELDTTVFWSYVTYHNKIVGFIQAHYLYWYNKWSAVLDIYDDNDMQTIFKKISETEPDYIFTIKYLGGLWFMKKDQVKVYSFYNKKVNSGSDYIKEISSVENIHKYAKGEGGGCLP